MRLRLIRWVALDLANPLCNICNVSVQGGMPMRYRYLQAALAASAALYLSVPASATDLEVTHWWTSGGEAAAVAEFAKAFDATGNKWVDGAIAGSGDTARSDHDQPHYRRRPDGRHAVQPRPPGRGIGRRRPDARPHRPRHQGKLGRDHPPEGLLERLPDRRQDLLRAGQYPFLAVAVAFQQGLRGGRRCQCRRTGTSSSPPRRRSKEAGIIPLAIGGSNPGRSSWRFQTC